MQLEVDIETIFRFAHTSMKYTDKQMDGSNTFLHPMTASSGGQTYRKLD